MKNELKRHKRSDGIKWLLVTVAVILLAVAVTAAITSGFKNWNPYGWLDTPQEEETERGIQSKILKASSVNSSFIDIVPYSTYVESYAAMGQGKIVFHSSFDFNCKNLLTNENNTFNFSCGSYTMPGFQKPTGGFYPPQLYFYICFTSVPDIIFAELNIYFGDKSLSVDIHGGARYEKSLSNTTADEVIADVLDNLRIEYKEKVLELPEEPIKEGYTFVGWYLDEDLTIPYSGEPITADMNFYAKFEINTFTVTFDCNGGYGLDTEQMTVEWNTAVNCPIPYRTGYNFLGWYMSDGTKYENQAVKNDFVLTAKWEIKLFTVTFKVDGEVYDTLTVEYGTVLVDIVQEANAQNLQVTSVRSVSGTEIADFTQTQVTEDYEVNVQEMTGTDKVVNTVKTHWLSILLSAGLLIAIAAVVCALIPKKKLHRR